VSLKAVLLVTVAAVLGGCSVLGSSGPTEVAKGEYYSAGNPAFDSFFIQLHELQVEVLAAPEEPRQVRSAVTKSVALQADASDESLDQRLRAELKKLEQRGLRVRLEVPDSPAADASATLHVSEGSVPSPLRSSLPEQATRLVRSRNRMQAVRDQLEQLRVVGIQLEGNVDRDFRVEGPWKRDEVRRNLSDGQKLITLMQARTQEVRERDVKLLALLSGAATTDASLGKVATFTPPPPPEESKPAQRAAPRPRSGAKPSAAAPSKPAAAPAKPREDEGASPKPVQGNAPAEIEP
jgi:hypothetical protein